MGDDSGVVVVPWEIAQDVLASAQAIEEAEKAIVLAVKNGLSLREAREKFGYHKLQAKKAQK